MMEKLAAPGRPDKTAPVVLSVDAVTAASAAQRTAVPRTHVTELLITAA